MCGIVGGVAERCVTEILIEGLKRLEYRGYDSAGVALPITSKFYVSAVLVSCQSCRRCFRTPAY